MSDARWTDVLEDARQAAEHFARSVQLYEAGGFLGDDLDAYRARMAFMHAVQSGHTSLEAALLRVFEILGEERPSGDQWHRDLISRAARAMPGDSGRPPILTEDLGGHADETRRFRNLATRSYGTFDPARARSTVIAAKTLSSNLLPALLSFQEVVDPPQ
ncbi:MAG TPA: hypothetical protein VN240_07485 [Propylenella sp.]|nr:hypothetical protein [Propylenella sp.]